VEQVAEVDASTTRRYYWVCPRCFGHVPRRAERCPCGGTKAERKRAHERVTPPTGQPWWVAAWLGLGSLGLLWILLE
jgi:ribosomal protein L40E